MPNLRVFHQKDANGKANSEGPDQTAPRLSKDILEEQSDLGLHCLPRLSVRKFWIITVYLIRLGGCVFAWSTIQVFGFVTVSLIYQC